MKLTDEQKLAASKLNERQLAFANLVLTKDQHGKSDADCYMGAGYKATTKNAQEVQACQLLSKPKVKWYIDLMQQEAAKAAGLTLEKVDRVIGEIMSGNIIDYLKTVEIPLTGGEVQYIPVLKCHLQDLPREVAAQIQEIKMTREGLMVKTYNRMDAARLAAQRLGGLTEKREHSGPGGGPIETTTKVIRVKSRKAKPEGTNQ